MNLAILLYVQDITSSSYVQRPIPRFEYLAPLRDQLIGVPMRITTPEPSTRKALVG